MKFRDGFVTNSSSTNFLIISKNELTVDYLFDKLGFQKGSPLEEAGMDLCREIFRATTGGVRYFDIEEVNFDSVLKVFDQKSAQIYKERSAKGHKTYMGYTSSDESQLTQIFTCDYFEIEENDFYLNGLYCVW